MIDWNLALTVTIGVTIYHIIQGIIKGIIEIIKSKQKLKELEK